MMASGGIVNVVNARRQVVVTPAPLAAAALGGGRVWTNEQLKGLQMQQQQRKVVKKLLLKAFPKSSKKDWKMFTLRDVDIGAITSCDQLKKEIKFQLSDDIKREFDVGFVQGTNLISIRNSHDVSEVWSCASNGSVTLWCDGLKQSNSKKSRKRKADDSETDDWSGEDVPKMPKKTKRQAAKAKVEEMVEEAVCSLKEKHGKDYTAMQYRMWGEMIGGGLHSSLDTAPVTSMFIRAGGGTPTRNKSGQGMAQALSVIANQMASPVAVPMANPPQLGSSPAKKIDSRSKCYKQLMELHNLMMNGVLTQAEYDHEKKAVVDTLHSL